MAYRACSALGIVSFVGVVGVFGTPCTALVAQAPDSTGMPSLDQLALEAGRASRRNPIRAVSHTLLCEPSHPLVDSASLAACAALLPSLAEVEDVEPVPFADASLTASFGSAF